MMKILLIICCILFAFDVEALEINSKYAVLYHLEENRVIEEINKDEKTSVASLTKIMTALVAIHRIKNFDEQVQVEKSMFYGLKEENAYMIGLKENQKVTYNDLLYGVLLASGADATRVLAISLAGSEEKFVELMNREAKALNLTNTHFENAIGLDAINHYSSVDDIAKLFIEAWKNEKFKEIFTTKSYIFQWEKIQVESTFFKTAESFGLPTDKVLGGKTGYTINAGRCLATIAFDTKNNSSYVLVTTNALKRIEPIEDALNTYQYYFENYSTQTIYNLNELLIEIPTKYSPVKSISISAQEKISYHLKNDYQKEEITVSYFGENAITPKMKKGTVLGKLEIKYQGKTLGEIEVKLPSSIPFSMMEWMIYHKNFFIVGGLCFLFYLSLKKRYQKHSGEKSE